MKMFWTESATVMLQDFYSLILGIQLDESLLTIDFTCMGDNDGLWGGSNLTGVCTVTEILRIRNYLIDSGITAIYVHGADCRM